MTKPFQPDTFIAANVRNIPRSGIRDFFDIVQGMKDVISLGVGEPDFVTPWHIREAAIFALEKGRTSYTSNLGLLKLREAIAVSLEKHFNVTYNPKNQIIIAVGVSEAMDIAFRAVINPGDEIIYHEPCYVSYAPGISLAHGVPVAVSCKAENGFAVTAEAIEKVITPKSKMLVLNFPTNPTGGTMTRAELQKIADVVLKHNLLVMTDEIYSELTFEGDHTSIASLPGMKIHQYSMLCASIISQEAALEAIQFGEPDTIEMRDQYRLRRNFIVDALNKMGLKCHLPRGSFYAFPNITSTGLSSKDFAVRLLQEEKVACVPGSAFGACGEGFVRCCYATNLDLIKEAMARLARFVRKHQ